MRPCIVFISVSVLSPHLSMNEITHLFIILGKLDKLSQSKPLLWSEFVWFKFNWQIPCGKKSQWRHESGESFYISNFKEAEETINSFLQRKYFYVFLNFFFFLECCNNFRNKLIKFSPVTKIIHFSWWNKFYVIFSVFIGHGWDYVVSVLAFYFDDSGLNLQASRA